MVAPPKPQPMLFDLTEAIIGVFFDVYNELGPGFQEFVFRRAMAIALRQANVRANEDAHLTVWFRGAKLITFRADLVVPAGPVLIEVKATSSIEPFHIAQTLGYLKATEIEVALILNFGRRPQFKRLVFENPRKSALHGGGQLEEC
jgi:GxxExxY protein